MRHKYVILLLALIACSRAPGPAPQAATAAAADTLAEGTVRVVGPAETAQVALTGAAGEIALIGPLAAELRRLAGATVRVTGMAERNPAAAPERAVNADTYEILSVNGERPFVGVLVLRDGRLWLAGSDTLELVGAPESVALRVGAKVFVTGTLDAGRVRLGSFGVIREPPP